MIIKVEYYVSILSFFLSIRVLIPQIVFCNRRNKGERRLGPTPNIVGSFDGLLLILSVPSLCYGNGEVVGEQRVPDKGVEEGGDEQDGHHCR